MEFAIERKRFRICLAAKKSLVCIEQVNQGRRINATTLINLSKQVGEEIVNRSCLLGGVGLMTWRDRNLWVLLEEKRNHRGIFLDLWFCEGGWIKRFCVPVGKNGIGWRRLGDALLWCDGAPCVQFQNRVSVTGKSVAASLGPWCNGATRTQILDRVSYEDEPPASILAPRGDPSMEVCERSFEEWRTSLARFQAMVVEEIEGMPSLCQGCDLTWTFEPMEMCMGWKVVARPLDVGDDGRSIPKSTMEADVELDGGDPNGSLGKEVANVEQSGNYGSLADVISHTGVSGKSRDDLERNSLDFVSTTGPFMGVEELEAQLGLGDGVETLSKGVGSEDIGRMPSDHLDGQEEPNMAMHCVTTIPDLAGGGDKNVDSGSGTGELCDILSSIKSPQKTNTSERVSMGVGQNGKVYPLAMANSGFRYFFCRKRLRKKAPGHASLMNTQSDSKGIQSVDMEGVPTHIRKAVDNFVESVDPAGVAGRLSLLSKLYDDLTSPSGKVLEKEDPWEEALGPKPSSQDLEDILAEHLKESENDVSVDIQ